MFSWTCAERRLANPDKPYNHHRSEPTVTTTNANIAFEDAPTYASDNLVTSL